MAPRSSRARFGAAVVAAFAGGLITTAALDLTPFGYAQQTGTARPPSSEVRSLEETGEAFVAIAEHVTPAVVSISAESAPRERAAPDDPRRRALPPGWEDFFRQFGDPRQQGPRQSILDLHPGPPPLTAADQQARGLDGLLGGHPAVDDVQNDAVDGGRNPRVPGTADRQPGGEPGNP